MNRILAVVWLIVALFAFGVAWSGPKAEQFPINPATVAWVAAFLAFYNVVRWWGMRLAVKERRPLPSTLAHRRYDDALRAPDPNFNFTDAPAPTGITKPDTKP